MSLQALTYWVVGLSFALYIAIAIWSRAHSTGDFYIAGKGVSPVANGMATAADWMSAASFISMAGLIAFLDRGLIAEDRDADVVFLEVENQAVDVSGELHQLTSHHILQTVDASDTVTHLQHRANVVAVARQRVDRRAGRIESAGQALRGAARPTGSIVFVPTRTSRKMAGAVAGTIPAVVSIVQRLLAYANLLFIARR